MYTKLFILIILPISQGSIDVSKWGMVSHMNRLAYTTYDVFKEAFNKLTAAQTRRVFPVDDIKYTYILDSSNMSAEVNFHAYNGWLEDLSLEPRPIQLGNLRRFFINKVGKKGLAKGRNESHHEYFMCATCLQLVANKVHYAFESSTNNHETIGTIENGQIVYAINFHMNIIMTYDKMSDSYRCNSDLKPLAIHMETENQWTTKAEGIGMFNFLADTLDQWIYTHFNNTVRVQIENRIDAEVRKVLTKRNVCNEFLSA